MSTPAIGEINRHLRKLGAPLNAPRIMRYLEKFGASELKDLNTDQQYTLLNNLRRITDKSELFDPGESVPPVDSSDVIAEIEVILKSWGVSRRSLAIRSAIRSLFPGQSGDFSRLDSLELVMLRDELQSCDGP